MSKDCRLMIISGGVRNEDSRKKGLQIWKFFFEIGATNIIEIPKGAKFLTAQTQKDNGVIWALVDPTKEKEIRKILTIETGAPINYAPEQLIYIATFQLMDGAFIVHVFEVIDVPEEIEKRSE